MWLLFPCRPLLLHAISAECTQCGKRTSQSMKDQLDTGVPDDSTGHGTSARLVGRCPFVITGVEYGMACQLRLKPRSGGHEPALHPFAISLCKV
jgi:hypothetical protein